MASIITPHSDTLADTGIDIRQEEQALADYYASSFAPKDGVGGVNQVSQPNSARTKEQLAAQAEATWKESALRLAAMRANEMENPFLVMGVIHRRAEQIAKEHGVGLTKEQKNPQNAAGRMPQSLDFAQPRFQGKGAAGMFHTDGSSIPQDAHLCDQLALLSIATKHRLREKIEVANNIAVNRQLTACGEAPAQWTGLTAPLPSSLAGQVAATNGLVEVNPLKRSFDAFSAPAQLSDGRAEKNLLAQAVRDGGKSDRAVEDARLLRRQKRQNPDSTPASRVPSAAPGTPGASAPEPEAKAPTKKEAKKAMVGARTTEVSTVTANATLNQMMGKKGKQNRWWMTAGGGGASTSKAGSKDVGTSPAGHGQRPGEKARLTMDGRYRLGTWREDGEKGKNIQLRDWTTALEFEGLEVRAIQDAYSKLDASGSR